MLFPEWTPLNIILYAFFTLFAIGLGIGEYTGLTAMQYSKFRLEKGIDSRLGMFILYFAPFLAALGLSLGYLPTASLIQAIVLAAVCGHFTKRCLEVLFLHKYSGPMSFSTILMIASFYTLNAASISYLNTWPLTVIDAPFWLGAALFVFGQAGNYLHHKILVDLRGDSKNYVLPRSGWFDYVACPHYLFEIIAWVGIALMSRHLFAWIALLGMAAYLLARSLKTLAWYRQKFPDFPKERKALIPFMI